MPRRREGNFRDKHACRRNNGIAYEYAYENVKKARTLQTARKASAPIIV